MNHYTVTVEAVTAKVLTEHTTKPVQTRSGYIAHVYNNDQHVWSCQDDYHYHRSTTAATRCGNQMARYLSREK